MAASYGAAGHLYAGAAVQDDNAAVSQHPERVAERFGTAQRVEVMASLGEARD